MIVYVLFGSHIDQFHQLECTKKILQTFVASFYSK